MSIESGTGQTVYSVKLKGKYNSSPIYADGNIYFCSTRGETMIIKEGRVYEMVARNKLDGEIWSTPATLRNNILIRTSKFLYRIGT